jgi:hypothetical protein
VAQGFFARRTQQQTPMAIMIGATTDPLQRSGMSVEERFVVFASSLGTAFEWYDFFLYAVLAPFFASLFFPPGNE